MKIVTYNVNSLRARFPFFNLFLDSEDPDVVCLQELKATKDQIEAHLEQLSQRGYSISVYGQPRWNGVLIASKYSIEHEELGFDGEFFEGIQQSRMQYVQTGGIHLVNLYCPQGQSADSPKFEFKKRFYRKLIDWVAQKQGDTWNQDPWLFTGDFNIAPEPSDVWDVAAWNNVPTYHPDEHMLWKELLSHGLSDVGRAYITEGQYTFWDNRTVRYRPNQGLRIDHFVGNEALKKRVLNAHSYADWRKARADHKPSDHVPVALEIQDS